MLLDVAIRAGLIAAVLVVYAQSSRFDFITYDDPEYVWSNAHVQAGLTPDSIEWAFSDVTVGNWAPVTLLSHMLVCQFFGMNSGAHHLVNVVFHTLAALLLFAVLRRATGARGASAFVAFIFALHPLHVESVAWVAERKDVLSAFFWFLGLYAYVRYAEAPSLGRYLMVVAPFCLGLMSKPMLVTFPFTLLLFDVWPLRRTQFPKILWEKLPLILLSALASVVTYLVQGSAGAFRGFPLTGRIENSLVSYVTYICQMFWPTRLTVFYPYPDSVPAWQTVCALAVLTGISALAIYTWRTRPYIATGWFWYLGTLVPVIGLVQVGSQSRADRYTYIPMVGLLWILAWSAADLLKKWPRWRPCIATVAIASCIACMALSWRQAGYWRNGVALFHHALDVDGNNQWARQNLAMAHNYLGAQLGGSPAGFADAVSNFQEALRIDPNMATAHGNLGILLSSIPGREAEALAHLEAAQRIHPDPDMMERINRARAAVQGTRP